MGESVSEVVLLEWLKADGEYVERDEPICILETDKANVDLPAPAAGILHLLKEVDAALEVGDRIAQIDESGSREDAAAAPAAQEEVVPAAAAAAPAAAAASAQEVVAPEDLSPAVRRLVEEHGLDPAALAGTGRDGRLTKEDVLAHLEKESGGAQKEAAAVPPPLPSPPPQAPAPASPPAPAPPKPAPAVADGEGIRRQPMTKIRQRIAERLVSAQHNAAMLTTFNEIDLSAVMALRARHKERFAEVHGVSLGLMSFFSRATALALKAFEAVNASIEGTDIAYHDYVNLGIAVSAERGLVVPVLRGAENMTLAQLEFEIKRLAKAARDNKLGLNELSGGTFTITNGGVFGSLLSTPILNPPQSGILGMHAIKERPVAVDGQVEIRPMMYVALSYDHRLVDGEQSVSFLVRIKDLLEDPTRLMLEI